MRRQNNSLIFYDSDQNCTDTKLWDPYCKKNFKQGQKIVQGKSKRQKYNRGNLFLFSQAFTFSNFILQPQEYKSNRNNIFQNFQRAEKREL